MDGGYPFIKDLLLQNCATRVREIVKLENEPQKNQKQASVAQTHMVGHPGSIAIAHYDIGPLLC